MRGAAAGARMLAVFIAALALNLSTAAPTVVEGDGAELQTVAILGGVAHPTGYPTWTLWARPFAALWPGEPARRVTASSAVAGAAAPVVVMAILRRLGAAPVVELAGALLVAAGVTVRWSSIYPEVYALASLLFLLALERTIHASHRPTARAVLIAATLLSLAVTGHFLFAPAAAVLGVFLLLRGEGVGLARRAGAIGLGVLGGLAPYLYTAWADSRGLPMNYLRLVVEPGANMFGLTPETFDSTWERIRWLVLGAETRLFPYYQHPRLMALNASDALAHEFLFDAGPLALVLAPLGAWSLWRGRAGLCATLVASAAASFLFAVSIADGRQLLPFLLPCTLVLTILAAIGVGRVASIRHRPAAGALAFAIAVTAALLPHAIRARARNEPIGPRRWVHHVEGGPELKGFWPRLDREWQPRRTGERALEMIPEGALVIGRWRELMTLYYLRDVEGRRLDLTFDPVYRGHEPRYDSWQRAHDLRERPFALLGRSPEVEPYLTRRDSMTVTPRLTLYVQREPMRGLRPMPLDRVGSTPRRQ